MEMLSKGEKMVMLQKEPSKPPSTQYPPNSDTESLAQDRAYYLPALHHGEASTVRYIDIGDSLEAETGERSEVHQGEGYDSLERSTDYRFEVRSSTPFPTRDQDAYEEMGGTEATGLHRDLPSEAYSDLRCDPSWRSNLKASECFSDSPQLHEEHQPGSTWRSRRMGEELVIKGGYKYVVTSSPSLPPGPPSVAQDEAHGPYHLHPQHGPATRGISGNPDHLRSKVLLLPEGNQTLGKGDTAVQRESRHGDTGENRKVPAQPRQNVPETQEVAAGKPSKKASKLKSPLLANRNLEGTREDIVERNKITLGRNTTKYGSYLKAHAPKQETDDMTWWEAPEEEEEEEEEVVVHGAECTVEEGLDQDLRWLQKTQQLKAYQSSRRDRPQQKGNPSPQRPTRAPRPGAADRPGPRLRPPPGGGGGGGGGGGARPQAMKEPSFKNTPPEVLPPISSSGDSTHSQTPVTSLAHGTEAFSTTGAPLGLHRVSYRDPETSVGYSDVQFPGDVRAFTRPLRGTGGQGLVALGYPQPKRGNLPLGFQNKTPSVGRVQRAQAPQWLLSYDQEHFLIHPPDEDEDIFTQDGRRWTGEVQLRRSGSHPVLPPIGDDGRSGGWEPRPSSGSISPMRRSSEPPCPSGYLAQMERQKQLKERVAYKVYTLKDYRQLRQVVNLCGLGPDKANEKTAEKMRRQRLYSNVIRERNKKTSTAPLLPPRDPEDVDKTVPRRKALEYAKSIAKPHPKTQPKKHQDQSEGFPGLLCDAHLEGLELAQLEALEDMRRRHEEEKQAVASFRKAHFV